MACYLDTSALVKLVVIEDESAALRKWLTVADRTPISSDLARSELMRAVRRVEPNLTVQARAVLDAITLLQLATATFEEAGRLDPTAVRTLDALHLASALELGDDLEAMVTYDVRLAEAARRNGISVIAPA